MATANQPLNGLTLNFVSPAFVLGTTSTLTTTVTSAGVVNGKFVTPVTALTNSASPTTDGNTGAAFTALSANKTCSMVVGQNAAGTVVMLQGPIIATRTGVTTTVGAFDAAPQFPPLPDNFLPWAYFNIRTAPDAAAMTPSSSSWTASGVTCTTPQNIACLPNRPSIA